MAGRARRQVDDNALDADARDASIAARRAQIGQRVGDRAADQVFEVVVQRSSGLLDFERARCKGGATYVTVRDALKRDACGSKRDALTLRRAGRNRAAR
jgi:GAF domain-containing protein